MKIKMIVTALLLSLALPAAADFRTIQAAYEVSLDDVRLPQIDAGTISFKKCFECPYETKRVTASTGWVINGKSMTLAKFRERLSQLVDRSNETATVLHHLERDRVTEVSVWIR